MKTKVGIVGYGKLGQFIADKIMNDPVVSGRLELSWVWNRSPGIFDSEEGETHPIPLMSTTKWVHRRRADHINRAAVRFCLCWMTGKKLPPGCVLENLDDFAQREADLIVEVSASCSIVAVPFAFSALLADSALLLLHPWIPTDR